ncbi:hypothetical protein WJX74_001881 [Apatococcus lobatus]|uniref:DNA mismatch repair proteins mutS family domain-containing protein n=1 Tax=Apatococcus lobatus TaxID=904363 RepID=A0AAW1RHC7_9CHLO
MTSAARRLCVVSFALSRASNGPQPNRVVLWRAPSWQKSKCTTAPASDIHPQRQPVRPHARKADINQTASLETQAFWEQLLTQVQKPNAKKLLDQLDLSNPMGVRVLPGRRTGKAPLYPYFLKVKHEHPRKIVLVRVGEFYETMGTDAILLVQHAGLNPMGQGNPPRAGCPIINLRKTLTDLVVEAGIPTVVCEEVPDEYTYGQRKSQKTRFVAGVVTPAQPQYMHGLVDGAADVSLEDAAPLLGISASVGGYQVMEVRLDTHTCTVMEGLTEDAVSARIHQGGMVPPLYIHKSAQSNKASQLSEASFEAEWMHRVAAVSRSQVGLVRRYSSPDPLDGLLEMVRIENGLAANTAFQMVKSSTLNRPKPLFLSTAQQLGIHRTRGMVSLLDSLLSSEASMASRQWLKRLLLLPPPTHIAHSIAQACQLLTDLQDPLPWYPLMSSRDIVLRLSSQEASDVFFRELVLLLSAVGATTSSDTLRPIAEQILQPVELDTGVQQDCAGLHAACRTVLQKIGSIIQDPYGNAVRDQDGNAHAEDIASASGMEILGIFFRHNETFRGKVQDGLMKAELFKVETAGQAVETELQRLYMPLSRVGLNRDLTKMRPCIIFDKDNNAIWLKIVRNSKASELSESLALEHPRDRNGKVVLDRWSTAELEGALNSYREACLTASKAVRMHLCSLAKSIKVDTQALVTASTFAVIVTTLENHVREASRRGWGVAEQLSREQCLKDDPGSRRTMEIDRMWPYWLDARSASTVTNSVSMSSMFLLTGPNMAGKSTILRSLCAVAVLGACGLMIPAARACLPYTDAFILRNFSADSPLEGRSSFAVEMIEMRHVLEDVTEHALILIDELGKGTEVKAGTAIAGAMLEQLHDSCCRGAFATHLHQLLDLPIRVPRLVNMMMETCAAHPDSRQTASIEALEDMNAAHQAQLITGRKPTWKMVEGTSKESLALDVALQWRVPAAVVRRAASLLLEHDQLDDRQEAMDHKNGLMVEPAGQIEGSSSHGPVGNSIHDAAARLQEASESQMNSSPGPAEPVKADSTFAGPQQLDGASLSDTTGASSSCSFTAAPMVIAARQNPPPSTVGCSCVYVVRRQDGWFYCGQTDDLRGRLQTHRRSGVVKGGPRMEAAYVTIPSGQEGQSLAKAIERQAILALQHAGFPMLSVTDSRSKQSPKGRLGHGQNATPLAADLSGTA